MLGNWSPLPVLTYNNKELPYPITIALFSAAFKSVISFLKGQNNMWSHVECGLIKEKGKIKSPFFFFSLRLSCEQSILIRRWEWWLRLCLAIGLCQWHLFIKAVKQHQTKATASKQALVMGDQIKAERKWWENGMFTTDRFWNDSLLLSFFILLLSSSKEKQPCW